MRGIIYNNDIRVQYIRQIIDYSLEVNATTKVSELKKMVSSKINVEMDISLFIGGKQLDNDDATMMQLEISQDSVVHFLSKIHG